MVESTVAGCVDYTQSPFESHFFLHSILLTQNQHSASANQQGITRLLNTQLAMSLY